MDTGGMGLDVCAVNTAVNVVQLAVLVALLRWVRPQADRDEQGD